MAPAKKTAPLLLILALVLTLSVLLVSTAARHAGHNGEGGGGGGGGFFGMPWFGPPGGGGWGAGYGGPGGFARHGVEPPSTVCMEKGPCYKKKLTCPAKCFKSFSFNSKHGGGGGGGGGCSFDCNKRCEGYC